MTPAEGLALFTGKGGCVACHAMNGVEGAIARVGPDLTHLQSREVFAGATFDLTPENLKSWITNPSKMKPDDRTDSLIASADRPAPRQFAAGRRTGGVPRVI